MKENSPISIREQGYRISPDRTQANESQAQEQIPPTVLRDSRGRVVWKLTGNNPEENEQLGIRNIQGLFLEKFPEFNALFPRGEDGKVQEDKIEEAKKFILEKIGKVREFKIYIGSSPLNKGQMPYFERSHPVAIQKSFDPWEVKIELSEEQDESPSIRRDKRGRIRWNSIPPEERKNLIFDQCRRFVEAGNNLTQGSLRRAGLYALTSAIYKYYPGGLVGIQAELGIVQQSAANYREMHVGRDGLPMDKNGRILWSKLRDDPERLISAIEAEISKFISTGNHYSQENLKSAGLSSLSVVISKYYPGGSEAIREKFGVKLGREQRNQNYWQPDVIREEAKRFFEETGRLSLDFLTKQGRSDLVNAIRHYPGGAKQLKIDLGIEDARKPEGYWTPKTIKEEANLFCQQYGKITYTLLKVNRMFSLAFAISKIYPGGIQQLQRDLGLELTRKPIGYWTEQVIEKEATEIYLTEGDVSITILEKLSKHDLINAINKKYPGGIRALREKLGITGLKSEDTIFPEEADGGSRNWADFDPSELSPELRQEILDRFAEFLEDNPDTQMSVIDFAMDYLKKGEA